MIHTKKRTNLLAVHYCLFTIISLISKAVLHIVFQLFTISKIATQGQHSSVKLTLAEFPLDGLLKENFTLTFQSSLLLFFPKRVASDNPFRFA